MPLPPRKNTEKGYWSFKYIIVHTRLDLVSTIHSNSDPLWVKMYIELCHQPAPRRKSPESC